MIWVSIADLPKYIGKKAGGRPDMASGWWHKKKVEDLQKATLTIER